MTIGGQQRSGSGTVGVINPATGQRAFEVPDCTAADLDEAFAAAQGAQPAWASSGDEARREALRACANALFGAVETLTPILTTEQGRPLAGAAEEIFGAGVWFNYYADLEVEPEVIQDDDAAFAQVVRQPMGVVAAITPWNYPLLLACWKLAPALRAGNTLVLKPSPFTPASTLEMVRLLDDVLPDGVLNVVSGGDDLGRMMTTHPVPRKVSFTGSVSAGRHVAASAAPDLKRVTLELGGNDAAIILDDADVDAIAEKLFWGAFSNSGQICSAIKRVYVPEVLEQPLVDALADLSRSTVVGDGTDETSQLGPINNRPQFDRVCELVDAAIADGGKAVVGGRAMDGDGYFVETTIMQGVREGSRIVDEEQFGPALPVMSYATVDEAVERANASDFGLSGSVWSADPDRATEVASRLQAGTVWANAHLALAPHQPFGGFKWSGLGVENGPWGLASFSEVQVQYTAKG